jgi:UDP-N-acetylmuramate: L-alanyl-gamma-D-glutamyl-meso-diaminopimelate ligase
MNLHFIAIGGSIMHSLAIALKHQGHEVSGSDDHIYDPAASRLREEGIIPQAEGWYPERIHTGLDAVILGMHAFEDNPELSRARELDLPVYSFPAFIFEQCRQKQRIVIAGSYGKTTTTAMVMHVLEAAGKKFDYMVGAQVEGFDNPVRLSDDAPMIVLEGDEYLASRLDLRPKFMLYKPHITVITGISWDHINVFPTEDVYEEQFANLLHDLEKAANIIYCEEDARLRALVETYTDANSQYRHPYSTPKYKVKHGRYEVKLDGEQAVVPLMGRHNMANLAAAWRVCRQVGIEIEDFFRHLQSFKGASIRLEVVEETPAQVLIRDYAHAPAKVKASVEAVRERYADRKLIAVVELHTFSSLDANYLPFYQKTLKKAHHRIVFVDPEAVARRRLPAITTEQLRAAFAESDLIHVSRAEELKEAIARVRTGKDALLLMSSGNFGGLSLAELKAGS